MKKYFIEWNGESFPVRKVTLPYDLGGYEAFVADYELWKAIKEDYDKGSIKAEKTDNDIYYYCNSGFIASDPTDEEIISYLIENA